MSTRLVALALLLCSCGGGAPPLKGCDLCPGSCWRDTVCDGGCHVADIACAESCTTDNECDIGSSCVDHDGSKRCSPYCTPSRCPTGSDCAGDPRSSLTRCLPVTCGSRIPCAAGAFCEMHDYECYPVSGICGADQPCPAVGGARMMTTCGDDQFCHVHATGLEIPRIPVGEPIVVTAPTVGQMFSTEAELAFGWSETGAPTIALVFDAPPANAEALDHARWGEAIAAGGTADWAHGHEIIDGVWRAHPGAAPLASPLYFVVEALSHGALVAISAPIPFAVGGGWKQPFDPCTQEDTVPGDCANPARPQGCHLHRCQVLCASQRDCDAHAETQGLACGLPVPTGGDPRPSTRFCQ